MSKEMIISVNGREKKIAIVDNGQVTEFYIERGEENSGVVGNIYKGRVMRVLPGMQSAFVDIGLERDGFLYVSDFFDEEEEIERIVLEKAKDSSREDAEREASDEVVKNRLKREKQMEDVQSLAEPEDDERSDSRNYKKSDDDDEDDRSRRGRGRGGRSRSVAEPEEDDRSDSRKDKKSDDDDEDDRSRRGRGRGGRGRSVAEPEEDNRSDSPKEKKSDDDEDDRSRRGRGRGGRGRTSEKDDSRKKEDSAEADDSDDGRNDRKSEKKPSKRGPQSDRDRPRKGRVTEEDTKTEPEKEKEKEKTKEVKSSRRGISAPKIDFDDSGFERIIDDEDTGEMFKDAFMQEAIVDKVRAIEFEMEGFAATEVGSLIDSVSDEPNGFERIADEDEEQDDKSRGKSASRSGRGKRGSSGADKNKSDDESGKDEKPKKKTSARKSSASKKKVSDEDESASDNTDAKEKKSLASRRKKASPKKKTSTRRKKTPAKAEKLADADASEKSDDSPAEMAVRRGSRGRRRSTGSKPSSDSSSEDTKKSPPKRGGGSRRKSSHPTITDLLTEGQEILVQIAKEPIARKGARITSHIALPGRYIVYMPTIEHLGVSRKIESAKERGRLRTLIQKIKEEVDMPSGGFIVRTAGIGISEEDLRQDARYLVNTWLDIRQNAEKAKSPALIHQDLDIAQRLLRDHLSDDFAAIRVDSEDEYLRIVEFVNRIQPKMVKRVKFYTRDQPILEAFGVQEEINKALKPRVWLKSGGYLVINQTEALIAIDVNTGKFVGKGNARLEDTITKTNMEAVEEISRQIRLRDLGGIIVLDLIDMEDKRNRHRVLQLLQDCLSSDKSPTKVLSFNDFGLIIMTRKRVKQSLERTLCSPCDYCQSAGWIKSPQTICYEILDESRHLSKSLDDVRQTTLRVHPEVARSLREEESHVLEEIEAYLGNVDVTGDSGVHQEQFDFAFI